VALVSSGESSIEKGVCEWAVKRGWLAWKLWGFNQVGLPDRIFIYKFPTIIFMEFKRPGKKPRRIQERVGKELAIRGFPWYSVDNKDAAILTLQAAMGTTGAPEKGASVAS
jgi:hypothetical protein